jgi:hypothetical protein
MQKTDGVKQRTNGLLQTISGVFHHTSGVIQMNNGANHCIDIGKKACKIEIQNMINLVCS